MLIEYDKTPCAQCAVKARAVATLVEAFIKDQAECNKRLDGLLIRGEWEGYSFIGYDYDLQSWLTIEDR